jgi:hypothetical protein
MVSKAKVKKIILDKYGSYLGMEKGCFTVARAYTYILMERNKQRRV